MPVYCGFCHKNLGEPTPEEFQAHLNSHESGAVQWKETPSSKLRDIERKLIEQGM